MANTTESPVLVIGRAVLVPLAHELAASGQDILAVEKQRSIVQHYSGEFTSVIQADTTDITALEQLGAAQFSTAVVGIGSR